jgi:hypothetical protein
MQGFFVLFVASRQTTFHQKKVTGVRLYTYKSGLLCYSLVGCYLKSNESTEQYKFIIVRPSHQPNFEPCGTSKPPIGVQAYLHHNDIQNRHPHNHHIWPVVVNIPHTHHTHRSRTMTKYFHILPMTFSPVDTQSKMANSKRSFQRCHNPQSHGYMPKTSFQGRLVNETVVARM